MNQARQLYDLQEIDLELGMKREALRRLESQLGESEAVAQTRAALDQERQSLALLQKEQRAAEWEVEDLQTKIKLLEAKLYGGQIRNPKELTNLQHEVEHLKNQRSKLEDRVLDIMGRVEALQSDIVTRTRQLKELEEEWQRSQAQLLAEQAELTSALATLEKRRGNMVSRIDAASLDIYEDLRARKQGRAVARVEQGMCQGCRINLPMSELQRVRMGEELVQCSSCGRILYLG